ncbi:MAG: GNAT family N-acetyltransferase [Anaerolineaceae bacterium]|nr:GNAT family N-acetyltransferase [Anaerolineaceae bacterium]
MITAIEECSLNAWPALQTRFYDGWVLRFADGYTRRANSVNALFPSSLDLSEKITACEEIYRKRNLPVVYKMTPAVQPGDLDGQLAARGYEINALTSVQTLSLIENDFHQSPQVTLEDNLSEGWLNDFCRLSSVSESQRKTLQNILQNILPHHSFVSLKTDGKCVACGMGVLENKTIGLYEIVTDEAFRGRGYGQKIVKSILAWGKNNGAQTSYLQVMCNNPPALRLYQKIGYKEQYQYWYRIKKPI